MQVTVNNIAHEIPFDLELISLGDFVSYYDQYGRDLDKELQEIIAKEYEGDEDEIEFDRTIDLDNHMDREALSWFSFWTKHDLFEVQDQPFITPILERYRLLRSLIRTDLQTSIDFPAEVDFNGDEWTIQDFKVNPVSDMSFNEIITSKEVMRQVFKMGKGKWDGLPYLCAIFLRKKNEPFVDQLIHEDRDRIELMKSLPFKHALQVAFFLIICVSIYRKTLVSSTEEEEEIINQS